jgi:hypothetical protein
VELYRLRVVNRKDGAVQVSTDVGLTWRLIGRVVNPATTAAEGYEAAHYLEPGTVAAVAVHGIRLRVGGDDPTLHSPLVLSIDPIEYAGASAQDIKNGYGGLVTGTAGILTDIHAGSALFRELAPHVGDPIYLESISGDLRRLPPNFRPQGKGETLVIPAYEPRNSLVEVTFENNKGGRVEARFADDAEPRQITRVVNPVEGTGRFDGTSYTGLGRLNTNHAGVITVSTAPLDNGGGVPEGQGRERRGGFQIVPAWHATKMDGTNGTYVPPVVMTLGTPPAPGEKPRRELEATAPLFRGTIGLGDTPSPSSEGGSAAETTGAALVDVSIDGGAWEPMPPLLGLRLDAFTAAGLNRLWKARGEARTCTRGVTAFRLRLPRRDPARSRRAALAAVAAYRAQRYAVARAGRLPIVKGVLTVNANPTNRRGVAFVRLRIEGVPRGFTNVSPFALSWDTRTVPDGEYLVEADAMDDAGAVLATTQRRVFVLNQPPPGRTSATTGVSAQVPALRRIGG